MQISQKSLFIFVEGYKDRYLYCKIAESACSEHGDIYELVTAEELPVSATGKQALVGFFDYVRRRSLLLNRFKGKSTVSLFFMDKDVDDFLRKKRRSEHVVYTETYEIENYLFKHGELCEAAAASASLDVNSVRNSLGDTSAWCKHAAAAWKEWVILCLFSHTRKLGSPCNYSRSVSPINNGAYGAVNPNTYSNFLADLERRSGLLPKRFSQAYKRLSKKVNSLYLSNQYDSVFKGRWYTNFLVEDIKRIANQRRFQYQRLEKRLLCSLAQTMNINSVWAEYFKNPIRKLLVKAGV